MTFPPKFFRPTWADVHLGALRANLIRLKRLAAPAKLLFVVKADGYGHGACQVSRVALESGAATWLGVSSIEEGILLRESGIRGPILILGSLYPFESTQAALHYRLTPTIASLEGARHVTQVMRRLRRKGARPRSLPCHLKLDTGMGRIGVRWPAGLEVARHLSRSEGVSLDGVYTHFASAESDRNFTHLQMRRFQHALGDMERAGLSIPWRHAANSAAALHYPKSRLDLVRPGLAAYGLFEDFRAVLSLKTRIVFLKNVPAGTPISYGGHYRTRRVSRIATVPMGYADGVLRALAFPRGKKRFSLLVRGQRCPVVGLITMDMLMVDVTTVPKVRIGEEVVVIGRSGREEITAGELAKIAGTIPYEIVAGLKSRVPRVYIS